MLGRALERRARSPSASCSASTAPLARKYPPSQMPADAPALVRKRTRRSGGRHARPRTARCRSLPGVDVVARRRRRAPRRGVVRRIAWSADSGTGSRSASGSGSLRDEAPGVGLGEAAADHHVLDEPPQALLLGEPAEHRPPLGQRERDVVEAVKRATSSTRSISRVHVAGAPGRDGDASSRRLASTSKPSRSRMLALLGRGDRRARRARSVRSGRRRVTGPLGQLAADVGVARDQRPPASSTMQLARERPRPAPRGAGRRPSPSGSRPRCEGRAARRCARMPTGSKFAASSRTSVVVSPTSDSRPPMIPAIATGRSASAIRRSLGSSCRSTPSSVTSCSPALGPADDDPPSGQALRVERVQRAAEREHDVVRDVDDVRDRADARADEARAQPERRRPELHAAEEPADVARAARRGRRSRCRPARRPARGGSSPGGGASSPVEQRGHLAREAVDGEQVGPVARSPRARGSTSRERQDVGERRAGLDGRPAAR